MSQLLVTRDLMFSSRFTSQARQLGIDLIVVNRLDMIQNLDAGINIEAVIVDLEIDSSASTAVMAWLQGKEERNAITTIAYAPHGQIDRLRAARTAGFDHVLTRGQFHEKGSELIAQASGNPSDEDQASRQEAT